MQYRYYHNYHHHLLHSEQQQRRNSIYLHSHQAGFARRPNPNRHLAGRN